jgi:hypothetical protein
MESDFHSKKEKYPEPLQMENVVWNVGSFCFILFYDLIT